MITNRGRAARSLATLALLIAGGGSLVAQLARQPGAASRERIYVSNERGRTVSVVDVAARRVIRSIPVPGRPRGIHLSADRRTLYVALSDDDQRAQGESDGIARIDVATSRVQGLVSAGSDPEEFAVDLHGRRLYASNEDAGTLSAIDLASGRVIATLIVGIEPEGVALSPDGASVYVTAETSNTVSVVDTSRTAVTASFMVDSRPRAAAFSPDGALAVVTAEIAGRLVIVDARRHRVLGRVALPAGSHPVGVVVSPDSRRAYVATGHGNAVAVVDLGARTLVTTITVGKRPWGVALSKDGGRLYTANGLSNDVSVVDTETRRVLATIPVGEGPWGVEAW
jgi:PQQ-dependent catabolism-associated beta-propeller protein